MIDAPLEKILEDDCSERAWALLRALNESAILAGENDILSAVRAAAVAFDLAPPVGAQLKIYRRILGEIPRALLQQATERLIKEYRFPGFPKPAEWVERAASGLRLIARARLMMQIYEGRLHYAELKYRGQLNQR